MFHQPGGKAAKNPVASIAENMGATGDDPTRHVVSQILENFGEPIFCGLAR
jgi:hypothetical protein